MFEAVRQIIETRVFNENYTTVVGDNLTSISSKTSRSIPSIVALNPSVDFDKEIRILLTVENNGIFSRITIDGFTTAQLAGTSTRLFLGNDAGGAGNTIASGGAERLFVRAGDAATDGNLEDKIADWVTLINGESSVGITAEADGKSIIIKAKEGVEDLVLSKLTISVNSFAGKLSTFTDAGIELLLSTFSFPMFLESREFIQPVTVGGNNNWGVLFINDSSVMLREFSNRNGLRSSGSVRVKLYAPRNEGTKRIRDMADEVSNILSFTAGDSDTGNGGTLFIKAGSLTKVSDDDDGSLQYNLDYIYDYYTNR